MNSNSSKLTRETARTVIPNSLHITGETGLLAEKITNGWLIGLKESNPAILDIFRERDVLPYRDLLSWSGEFAGKHITGAYYIYRITRSQALFDDIISFIDDLISCQDTDGYLGCFSKECRLTGAFSQNPNAQDCTWDAWNHYHIMMGLLLWYNLTGREDYLNSLLKIAGLFMSKFYNGKPTLASIGSTEMNLAPYHIFVLLYELTGESKYLYFAKKIEGDISGEDAGDYINASLSGVEFYQCKKNRWESLHTIAGIAEMYAATGEAKYLISAEKIVRSIFKTDVHNTGAFSTDEQAIGNPYTNSNIETCCVVAFNALVSRLWSITGESKLLDFLELSHYNAVCGSFSLSGKWSTYSTPMDGVKCANTHEINFQCRPGSPQLNCCSVNAPRGVGQISDWMFTEQDGVLCVNFYESFEADFDDRHITCESDYPAPGEIHLSISGKTGCPQKRPVSLRIPGWTASCNIIVNGKCTEADSGSWYRIESEDDIINITLSFDFTPRTEPGAMGYEGKYSIYVGPVLYGADAAHNPKLDIRELPKISRNKIALSSPVKQIDGSILWQMESADSGKEIKLCDFYHLGSGGSLYRTWLTVSD